MTSLSSWKLTDGCPEPLPRAGPLPAGPCQRQLRGEAFLALAPPFTPTKLLSVLFFAPSDGWSGLSVSLVRYTSQISENVSVLPSTTEPPTHDTVSPLLRPPVSAVARPLHSDLPG